MKHIPATETWIQMTTLSSGLPYVPSCPLGWNDFYIPLATILICCHVLPHFASYTLLQPTCPSVSLLILSHSFIAMQALMPCHLLSFVTLFAFSSILFKHHVEALASTDTITWGGSNDRTGYQNNHNMDPAVVGSAQFGLLFKTLLPGTYPIGGQAVPEQIFSQPLVYTGSDGVQYLYIATTQNNLYKLNAKTGVIVASRNIARPFLVSDLNGCVDINPTVGVTATGVIDPDTVCSEDHPLGALLTVPPGHVVFHLQNLCRSRPQWSNWTSERAVLYSRCEHSGFV